MAQNSNPLLIVLAVIGGHALILILGSWLLHGAMMSGGMMGGMMDGTGAGVWLVLLLVTGIVAAVLRLTRRSAQNPPPRCLSARQARGDLCA